MKHLSSLLTLSVLAPFACDPGSDPDTSPEPRAHATSPVEATTTAAAPLGIEPARATLDFAPDDRGGFVATGSDTIRVDAEGLAVRLGKDTMRFTLRSWGRADRREAAELADPRLGACATEPSEPDGDCTRRVEQSHGSLTAWVARRPGAVEQGWTLAERPAGAGPVELHLAVTGAELVAIEDDAAELATAEVRWRYTGLKAWDAAGKDLPARLARSPEGLAVIVDDTDARYPIEIDPALSASQIKLMAQAPLQEPSYVMPEKYNYGAAIRDVGDLNGDGYDDIAIGAPIDYTWSNAAHTDICRRGGRVYVYYGSPLGIDPQSEQVLEPRGDGQIAMWEPLSIDGDIAPEEDCTEYRFGADLAAGEFDNWEGRDLVIGAPSRGYDDEDGYVGGNVDRGRVWVYYNQGNNTGWAAPLFAPWCTQLQNRIGTSVDTITIGATSVGIASAPDPALFNNSIYFEMLQVFESTDCIYGDSCAGGEIYSPDPFQYSRFGHRVRFLGDAIAVAAPRMDTWGAVYAGVLLANPTQTSDGRFGWDIDDAGDVDGDGIPDLIVGAPGNAKKGSAYLYRGLGPALFSPPIELLPPGVMVGDEYGTAVAGVGDINEDGFDDLVIGSPNDGYYDAGVAYLYLGDSSGQLGNNGIPFWPMEMKPNGFFGHRVSPAGDVNGDKRPDLMVSACDQFDTAFDTETQNMAEWCTGAVFVFTDLAL